MSFHFRDGKVIFLDAQFKEWEATPTDTITTKPDPRGVAQRITLDHHVLMLTPMPTEKKEG